MSNRTRDFRIAFEAMTADEIYDCHVTWLKQLMKLSDWEYGEICPTTNEYGVTVPTVVNKFDIQLSVQPFHNDEPLALHSIVDNDAFVSVYADGQPYNIRVGIDSKTVPNIIGLYSPVNFIKMSKGGFTQQQKRSHEISERFWALSDSEKFEYSSKLLTQITTLLGLECETPSIRLVNEYVKEGYVSTLDEQGRLHALKQPACPFFSIMSCDYVIHVILNHGSISSLYGHSFHVDIDNSPFPNIIGIHDIERYLEMLKV